VQVFVFDYWNKKGNLDDLIEKHKATGVYIGNEACPEFFRKNIDNFKELSFSYNSVLVLPPLPESYFNLLEKILDFNVKEITVNDFGTFNFLKEQGFKINLGRLLIKFKTGNFSIGEIEDDIVEELKEPLISDKLLKFLKDQVNLIELNPVVQGIKLNNSFKYSLYWPYVINATTFMCWSNVDKVFTRTTGCNTLCKKFEGDFLGKKYFLMGNQTLFKNEEELENYLKRIENKEQIERIVFLKY